MSRADEVVRLRQSGLKYSEIGQRMGMSVGHVAGTLHRVLTRGKRNADKRKFDNGLFMRLIDAGFNSDQIAIAMNRARTSVTGHATWVKVKVPAGLPSWRLSDIRRELGFGRTVNEIADKYALDARAIQARCILKGWAYPAEGCPDESYLYAFRASAAEHVEREVPPPPTFALIRLARHDPVFARVLRERLALRHEDASHYGA